MTELFIHSSAFVALNDNHHVQHFTASEFVQSLLSDSVTMFTSLDEVVHAATTIKNQVGEAKEQQFLSLVYSGGIRLLYDSKANLQEIIEMYSSFDQKDYLQVSDVQCVLLMKQYGIKHVMSFNTTINSLGVIVVPKK